MPRWPWEQATIEPSWSSVWPFWNSAGARKTDTLPSVSQRRTRSPTTSLHRTEPSCGSQTGPSAQVAPVASRRRTAPGRSNRSKAGSSMTGTQPATGAPSATGSVFVMWNLCMPRPMSGSGGLAACDAPARPDLRSGWRNRSR